MMPGGPLGPAPGAGLRTGERVERIRAWVEALTTALEGGDLDAAMRGFAVECSWQPGPFVEAARGKAAIRALLAARLATMPRLDTRAEILGAGATYGVVHWSLSWGDRGPGERADGLLLVALDPMGRGSAVREWTVEDGRPLEAP
jgi:limonene-1,2-epoxide hydrolase